MSMIKSPAPSIKSVTIIRQDVLPDAGPAVQSGLRLARFAASVAVLVTPIGTPDKFFTDVTHTQTHTFGWEVSKNPVESGGSITDHVRKLFLPFSFSGLITDTPLFPPIPFFVNRAQKEFAKLLSFAEERETVFVATSLKVYPEMIISEITVSRDASTGGSIPVSIVLVPAQFASANTAGAKLLDEAAASAGAVPATNGGTQALTPGVA